MSGDSVWQDRDVRFDISPALMRIIAGEKILRVFSSVEDTTGNSGDRGCFMVTNLRIMWHSVKMPKVNLSIGLKCIVGINPKLIQSKIQGIKECLLILTSTSDRKFEFIFTNLAANDSSLFMCIRSIHRAYESSKMYRDLKLRGSLLEDLNLKILPQEEIFREVHGTYNLSNDQGSMGVMLITNIRAVWYALSNSLYNASIPYFQVKVLRMKESKFGLAIVFEMTEQGGGYLLGFRVDPVEKMKEVFKEMKKLQKVYMHNPIFGVEYQKDLQTEEYSQNIDGEGDKRGLDKLSDSVNDIEERPDAFSAYFVDSMKDKDRELEFNESLGLMMEKLPEGYSLSDLWDVTK